MGVKKKSSKKSGSIASKAKSALGALKGSKSSSSKGSSGRRRGHGPAYYQNKILVLKLKKRLNRLKYGGR